MRKILGGTTAALLALAIAAAPVFAGNAGAKPGTQTIVEIVVSNSNFDVLKAAVIRAGLAGVLSSTDDQFTVFAPTDAAFETAFSASEADVIDTINSGALDGALTDILLYHVTNGRRTSSSVVAAPGYQMLNGDRLTRSELVAAGLNTLNISASNGVIHVINSVLIP